MLLFVNVNSQVNMNMYGVLLQAPLAHVSLASPRALSEVTTVMTHGSNLPVCEAIIVIIIHVYIIAFYWQILVEQ
jgi:small neutral amino acid transporter SnatA (MarC family)